MLKEHCWLFAFLLFFGDLYSCFKNFIIEESELWSAFYAREFHATFLANKKQDSASLEIKFLIFFKD